MKIIKCLSFQQGLILGLLLCSLGLLYWQWQSLINFEQGQVTQRHQYFQRLLGLKKELMQAHLNLKESLSAASAQASPVALYNSFRQGLDTYELLLQELHAYAHPEYHLEPGLFQALAAYRDNLVALLSQASIQPEQALQQYAELDQVKRQITLHFSSWVLGLGLAWQEDQDQQRLDYYQQHMLWFAGWLILMMGLLFWLSGRGAESKQ